MLASTVRLPPPAPSNPARRGVGSDLPGFLLRAAAVVSGLTAIVYGYQVLLADPATRLQFAFPWRYALYGLTFLAASTFGRSRAWIALAVLGPCAEYLFLISPWLLLYAVVVPPLMHWALGPRETPSQNERLRFWALLLGLVVLAPKVIQSLLRLPHGSWLDVNQNVFVGLFLRYAYYYWERMRGFAFPRGLAEEIAYLFFVPQITGMLNLPPSEMSGRWGFQWSAGLRRGAESVGWATLKIPLLLYLEAGLLPRWGYSQGYPALREAGVGALWLCLLLAYAHWYLLISTKFDLMIGLFRFFGVDADDNFRWPLLATSPVELWRRWNVYNRRLLLKFVYFPLGGNRRWVYRNILATFLASALLLHTGYLGSPWWGIDPRQLGNWVAYFAAQGALVCAAYWWMQRPFWATLRIAPRRMLRAAGWAFTLLSSAWLHVLPLAAGSLVNEPNAPIADFSERACLMLRALGLGGG